MKIIKRKEKHIKEIDFITCLMNRLNEYRRAWYCKLDEEKKNKIRKDARDRYYTIKVC